MIGRASGCICGKRMLERINEGTCLWCGRGLCRAVREHAYRRNMEDNGTGPAPAQLYSLADQRWTEDDCVAAYRRWHAANGRPPHAFDWNNPPRDAEPEHPTFPTIRRLFGGWPGFLRYVAEVPREQAA